MTTYKRNLPTHSRLNQWVLSIANTDTYDKFSVRYPCLALRSRWHETMG